MADPVYLNARATVDAQTAKRVCFRDGLRVGQWKHPASQKWVAVPSERLDSIVAGTKELLAAGVKIPVPLRHTLDPRLNTGWLVDLERVGDSLALHTDIEDDTVRPKIGRTIQDVSVMLERDVLIPSTGRTVTDAITHVALCLDPVVNGQRNFVQLSREGETLSVDIMVPHNEDKHMAFEAIAKAVGLSASATEAEIASTAVTLSREVSDLRADVKEKAEALSRTQGELQVLKVKHEAAEAELSTLREEALSRTKAEAAAFIEKIKRVTAEAGAPASAERIARVQSLFDEGNVALAREIGGYMIETAEAVSGRIDGGAEKAEKPDPDTEALSRSLEAVAAGLRSQGVKCSIKDGDLVFEDKE